MSLSEATIVNVTVAFSPLATQTRNFGALLILGSSGVIDTNTRIRSYSSITGVATDFGTTAPEYLAALQFFSQNPQPSILYIGEWAKTATKGQLLGAPLTTAQQAIAPFQAITTGAITFTIDGTAVPLTAINLASAQNLNAVAGILTTALTTHGTMVWNAALSQFIVTSSTTGVSSTVAATAATPLAALLKVQTTDATQSVAGIAAETLPAAVTLLADKSVLWYGLAIADPAPATADILAVAAFIEAEVPSRILGVTSMDANELVPGQTTSLGYQLNQLARMRTFVQYSSTNPYAAVSALGRAFTVDFSGSRTTITLKFKNEPGVIAENLSQTQASALAANKVNVFASYTNGSSILQEGTMSNGYFFDEVQGLDWLQNGVQTDVYNLLLQAPKVPQTDAGVAQIVGVINNRLTQGVTNGLIAAGVWNASGFGSLDTGDTLPNGFYTYAPLIATQSQADREARKAPLIQVAVKLAGAIHFVNVAINVNR